MALTETEPIPLGFKAPDFHLPNVVTGSAMNLDDVRGTNGLVVMFICNHCPYVVHVREVLVKVAKAYQAKDIGFVAISANDIEKYPQDAPDKMKALAELMGFSFPYLYDASQETALAYSAACTPDFSVFDASLKCVYRGRFDDSTPGNNRPVTGTDLSRALDRLLKDGGVVHPQLPSIGCNIKWK